MRSKLEANAVPDHVGGSNTARAGPLRLDHEGNLTMISDDKVELGRTPSLAWNG